MAPTWKLSASTSPVEDTQAKNRLYAFPSPYGYHVCPRGPCKGTVRHLYGHISCLTHPNLYIAHERRMWSCGVHAWTIYGLFMIYKPIRGLQSYNIYIETLRASHGETKIVPAWASAWPCTGPCEICLKYPGASQYRAPRCDMTGALITSGVSTWMSNYIPYESMDVITHTCVNLSWSLVKGT